MVEYFYSVLIIEMSKKKCVAALERLYLLRFGVAS